VLMPHNALSQNEDCRAFLAGEGDAGRHLTRLSQTFKVSRYAVLTRLLTAGSLPRRRYESERRTLPAWKPHKGGRGLAPAARSISERGRSFTTLILRAIDRGLLSYADVVDYLGIRLKHLPELQEAVGA